MRYIKTNALPIIEIAHTSALDYYENILPPRENVLELCYFSEGQLTCTQGDSHFEHEKFGVSCNLCETPTKVFAPKPHTHHSIVCNLTYEYCDETDKDAVLCPRYIPFTSRERIHDILDEIIYIHTTQPSDKLRLAGLMLQAIAEYEKAAKAKFTASPTAHVYVYKAKQFVYEHLYEPITQKQVADSLNLSPEYLCSLFKNTPEKSVIRFINSVKLSQILTVMQRENRKLHEASALFGYEDPNYVSRLFKLYYGKTVRELLAEKKR